MYMYITCTHTYKKLTRQETYIQSHKLVNIGNTANKQTPKQTSEVHT